MDYHGARCPQGHAMNDRAPGLARVLSLRDLIAIVFGTVIGSGVFIIPGTVLRRIK